MTRTIGTGKPEIAFEVAFFVTSHGFGHAARACAVAEALLALRPEMSFAFYSEVPSWFFEDSLGPACVHRVCRTDVGLVQDTPFQHDVGKTLSALQDFFPFERSLVDELGKELGDAGCRLVICDVSALGIAVARACGISSVLLENFTWDWVYEDFLADESGFEPFVHGLREIYAKADHHLQTEPVCLSASKASLLPSISRACRTPRSRIRAELGVPEEVKLGLITTGGIHGEMECLNRLRKTDKAWFLAPGGCEDHIEHHGNVVLMSHRSGFHYPDLVAASDFLVGKAGYGTIAEARASGVSFAHVLRENFRESACLREYLCREDMGFEISEEEFHSAAWLDRLDELLATSGRLEPKPNGAEDAAATLDRYLR